MQVLQLFRERYPGSLEPRNPIKSHCTTNLTQETYWERHKRVVAPVQARNSREINRKPAYIEEEGFSRVDISSVEIDGIPS